MIRRAVFTILMLVGAFAGGTGAAVREPVVAGRFYPGDSVILSQTVRTFLREAAPPSGERPIALVAPHAGYVYSGRICADAFKQAADFDYDLIVILGTRHTAPGRAGISLYPGDGYRTPLGVADIDRDTARRLSERNRDVAFDAAPHRQEHSIEVILPFVQTLFPGVPILPVVVGPPDRQTSMRFGETLARELRGRSALIVASSDLSHYPGYDDAVAADRQTLSALTTLDPETFETTMRRLERQGIPGLVTPACGEAPMLAAMTAARRLGADQARVISYANSGDAAMGGRDRVVGYAAVSFTARSGPDPAAHGGGASAGFRYAALVETGNAMLLDSPEQKVLLGLARDSILQHLESGNLLPPRHPVRGLEQCRGVFVTLKNHDRLRGCIGHMADDLPLYEAVPRMAIQAAFSDPRFPPLQKSELETVEIEISVLTPFRKVPGFEHIVTGRDGVLFKKGTRRAVFLPQVAPEQGWTREEMLSHLSRKAGLSSDAWRSESEFYTFQAQVFSESEMK